MTKLKILCQKMIIQVNRSMTRLELFKNWKVKLRRWNSENKKWWGRKKRKFSSIKNLQRSIIMRKI